MRLIQFPFFFPDWFCNHPVINKSLFYSNLCIYRSYCTEHSISNQTTLKTCFLWWKKNLFVHNGRQRSKRGNIFFFFVYKSSIASAGGWYRKFYSAAQAYVTNNRIRMRFCCHPMTFCKRWRQKCKKRLYHLIHIFYVRRIQGFLKYKGFNYSL